jgi:hypothetical protein
MANLAPILYSNATVSAPHAPSINAAFKELYDLCGIKPQVLNAAESEAAGFGYISGGSRDLAQSNAAGTGAASDHFESNAEHHAAVDINNQRAFRNALGDAVFEGVLAKHGWHNITIDGAPFPTEPWHFANHDAVPQRASLDTTTFDNTEEEEMIQPLNTRVIRSDPKAGGDGNIVMLYPSGVAVIGDPLIRDIGSADGQAMMAGQPKNAEGHYWIDLPKDRFGWEIDRHRALLAADDAHITALIKTVTGK